MAHCKHCGRGSKPQVKHGGWPASKSKCRYTAELSDIIRAHLKRGVTIYNDKRADGKRSLKPDWWFGSEKNAKSFANAMKRSASFPLTFKLIQNQSMFGRPPTDDFKVRFYFSK